MCDLLKEKGAPHIKIFGGGGGTILPSEIKELHDYGITRIYHPDDGRTMGLQGMINNLVQQCDFPVGENIADAIKKIAIKIFLPLHVLFLQLKIFLKKIRSS